jgi:hypothetical protein
VYPDNYILFCKEHIKEKTCLKCGKSRFIEVVNEDSDRVMTEVAHKQLRCFPITPQLKQLFILERTTKHMRWHKEDILRT